MNTVSMSYRRDAHSPLSKTNPSLVDGLLTGQCIIRVTEGDPDDEPMFAPEDKKRNEEVTRPPTAKLLRCRASFRLF